MAVRRIPGHAVQPAPKIPSMQPLRKKARRLAPKQQAAPAKKRPREDGAGRIIDVEA